METTPLASWARGKSLAVTLCWPEWLPLQVMMTRDKRFQFSYWTEAPADLEVLSVQTMYGQKDDPTPRAVSTRCEYLGQWQVLLRFKVNAFIYLRFLMDGSSRMNITTNGRLP